MKFHKKKGESMQAEKHPGEPKHKPGSILWVDKENPPASREQKLATDHVDWLLGILRPLMITEFLHGYKHGREDAA